ncbi:prepilin-type N-terminal cleavage/methylation domain-containing protein [Alicyclobacillus acidocaldarius]|uniref:prepilin-type N-terminal cleavage/methylation domain-containing protein n=1 Tax=Alicyclobacillus acidocaldarius TaxID=405212 RepID=UPI00059FE41E
MAQRAGMTLIEVLVAITITAIVMGGLITSIWQISLRAQRLTAANQAMESVLTVNHMLTRMIGSSSYVEITYDASSGLTRLWLFRGGVPSASAVLPSQPWMYNSSTRLAFGMSGLANVSATPPAIYNANCYYLIEFVPNATTGSNNVYAMPATQSVVPASAAESATGSERERHLVPACIVRRNDRIRFHRAILVTVRFELVLQRIRCRFIGNDQSICQ